MEKNGEIDLSTWPLLAPDSTRLDSLMSNRANQMAAHRDVHFWIQWDALLASQEKMSHAQGQRSAASQLESHRMTTVNATAIQDTCWGSLQETRRLGKTTEEGRILSDDHQP